MSVKYAENFIAQHSKGANEQKQEEEQEAAAAALRCCSLSNVLVQLSSDILLAY